MKIVITYTVTDGCTYWSDLTFPTEYESTEAFLVHFDDIMKTKSSNYNKYKQLDFQTYWKERNESCADFILGGLTFNPSDFFTYAEGPDMITTHTSPKIETLEEWFENARPKNTPLA